MAARAIMNRVKYEVHFPYRLAIYNNSYREEDTRLISYLTNTFLFVNFSSFLEVDITLSSYYTTSVFLDICTSYVAELFIYVPI